MVHDHTDVPTSAVDASCTCSGVATVGPVPTPACFVASPADDEDDAPIPYRLADSDAEVDERILLDGRLDRVWCSLATGERRTIVRLAEVMTRSKTVRAALLKVLAEELGE